MGRTNYLVAVMALVVVGMISTPLAAAEEPPPEEPAPVEVVGPPNPVTRIDVQRRLVFPVVGSTYYYSGFGACRDACTREHHGVDIMSYYWKGLPVVAAASGTIVNVTYDDGNPGCSVRLKHDDRWETRYYHLNNDFPLTDEVGYPCPAPGIEVGAHVEAGQLLGYIGDSGNAETTPAHLHFELRSPSGYPIDPYRSLKAARRVTYEWLPGDLSATTVAINSSVKPDPALTTLVMTADEAHKLAASETDPVRLNAPVVVVDPSAPELAIDEIRRHESRAIVIMSDTDVRWLEDLVSDIAPIIEHVALPSFDAPPLKLIPDAVELPVLEANPYDSFATVVSGNVDGMRDSYTEGLDAFTTQHRSIVMSSEWRGTRYLGLRSSASPGRYADRKLMWWATGDGWVGTESDETPPPRGVAYVTERTATPWTLAFLGSIAEAPQMPRWKSR